MNEHLKRFIGQNITIEVRWLVNGIREVEYVQGTFKDLEKGDTYVISQYIPYGDFLAGSKPQSIERRFKVSEVSVISNFRV